MRNGVLLLIIRGHPQRPRKAVLFFGFFWFLDPALEKSAVYRGVSWWNSVYVSMHGCVCVCMCVQCICMHVCIGIYECICTYMCGCVILNVYMGMDVCVV